MSNSIVAGVYRFVIDDVISNVRAEFEDMGIDDAILQELQRSWETKVALSRVANFSVTEDSYYAEDADADATAGAGGGGGGGGGGGVVATLQYPPTSAADSYSVAAAAASLTTLATAGAALSNLDPANGAGRPQAFMPPRATTASVSAARPSPTVPTGPGLGPQNPPRNELPQTDGAADDEEEPMRRQDATTQEIDALMARKILVQHSDQDQEPPELDMSSLQFSATSSTGASLSLDSLPEEVQALVRDVRKRQALVPQKGKGKGKGKGRAERIPQVDGDDDEEDDDEDDINSDLDDSDEDEGDVEGAEEMEHIILCLYDKVTRTKNKWKCVLKDGIMLVNGRDYLFHRANGDFEW